MGKLIEIQISTETFSQEGGEFTLTSSLTLSVTHERFTNKLIFEFTVLLVTIVLNAKQEKQENTLI